MLIFGVKFKQNEGFSFCGSSYKLNATSVFDVAFMSICYSQHRISTSTSIFLLECEVSFKYHIGQIIKTSYCHLKDETILCPYLSLSVYEKLAQGFISSKLDNCNALLTGLPSGLITKLEQNSFAREVYFAKKDRISP